MLRDSIAAANKDGVRRSCCRLQPRVVVGKTAASEAATGAQAPVGVGSSADAPLRLKVARNPCEAGGGLCVEQI